MVVGGFATFTVPPAKLKKKKEREGFLKRSPRKLS